MLRIRTLALCAIFCGLLVVPTWGQDEPAMPDDSKKEEEHPEAKKKRDGGRKFDMAQIVKRFDKNGDGALQPEEMAALRKMREERALEGKRDLIVQRFDEDGDGTLNAEERANAEAYMAEERARVNKLLDAIFTRMDKDGDGALNPEELSAMHEAAARMGDRMAGDAAGEKTIETGKDSAAAERAKMGRKMQDYSPAEMIAKFDKDGDGGLSAAEIEDLQKARADLAVEGQRDLLMARFDADKDGTLNEEEKGAHDRYVELMKVEARQKIYGLMERADGNKDGALSKDEIDGVRAMMEGRTKKKAAKKGDAPAVEGESGAAAESGAMTAEGEEEHPTAKKKGKKKKAEEEESKEE